jgi:uncharacterized protein YyaL (SSP411 family)
LEEEDLEHGGFGTAGKFVPSAPLQLALACRSAAPGARLDALIVRTLDAVCHGGLFDQVDGGLFRYAAHRDFTRPHTEKLLEDQSAFLPVLLDAAAATSRREYRQRAGDVVRYVHRTLFDPSSAAFLASQQADDEYYAVSGSIRATMDAPRVDRTVFTDLNAQAIVAWLHAARALEDAALERIALEAADRVLVPAYVPGNGFRHWADPAAPVNLLTDQVHGARALLHVFATTRDKGYLARAQEAMSLTVDRMWDARAAGFLDRAPDHDDVGLLRDVRKPAALNSLAARVLVRLGGESGATDLHARARETLGALTGTYRADGLAAAPYALAVMDVLGRAP